MSEVKLPTTYQEQVEILKQRGCIISDDNLCMDKLSSINYYRLSAYFLPFKQKDGSYQKETSFDHVYQIYEFDRKLRNLLFRAVEVIEISLRTRLSYFHGHKYGSLGYLNPQTFNRKHDK